jgi:hypothetical protein
VKDPIWFALIQAIFSGLAVVWAARLWRQTSPECPETFHYESWPPGLWKLLSRIGAVFHGLAGLLALFSLMTLIQLGVLDPNRTITWNTALQNALVWKWVAWGWLWLTGTCFDTITNGKVLANLGSYHARRQAPVVAWIISIQVVMAGVTAYLFITLGRG